MEITVNGKSYEYSGQPTLRELASHLGIDLKRVAVERNHSIIVRSRIESEPLEAGDEVEIIRLVGGG